MINERETRPRIVVLWGPPASGKYTIGKRVAEATGLALFHNHLAVDLATSLFEFGSPGFCKLRAELWEASFQLACDHGQGFVFTFAPERTVSQETLDRLLEIARSRGNLILVHLRCSPGAVRARLDAPSRRDFGKLRDPELYDRLLSEGCFETPAPPPFDLELDAEALSPEEAARTIVAKLTAVS